MTSRLADRIRALGPDAAVWGGFVLLHALLFWLDHVPSPRRLVGDEVMYTSFARALARGEPASLDLLWPTFYGWFLAPAMALGPWGLRAAVAAQVLLLALAGVAFRALALRLTGSEPVARAAQAFLLLDPQVAAFAHYFWPEIPHLAFFVAMLWLLVARPGRLWWVFGGLAMGAVCLTKSIFQPLVPFVLLALARDLGWRRGLPRALAVLATAAVVVAPTVIANGRAHGAWTIADSSRFNLWVGLNTTSRRAAAEGVAGREYRRYVASGETFGERQAVLDRKLAALWHARGPLDLLTGQLGKQYFRLLDKDSFLTEQLPGGMLAARGRGYPHAAAPLAAAARAWSFALYALVLGAAGLGLTTTPLRGRPWLQLLWLVPVYGMAIFLVLEAKSRYRIPLLPTLYLAAALTLAGPREPRPGGVEAADRPARRWAGALLAALLLGFAFGGPLLR